MLVKDVCFTVLIFIVCYHVKPVTSANYVYQTEMDYYNTLVSLYQIGNLSTSAFMAKADNDTQRVVTVRASLLALQDIDEVDGTLELMIYLQMDWRDDIVIAATGLDNYLKVFPDYFSAQVTSLLVPYGTIWTPTLVLVNAIDSLKPVGNEAYRPRYYFDNGNVTWSPRVKVRSACSPDVTFYPFDRQTCSFEFVAWGLLTSEMIFRVSRSQWDFRYFEENGEWTIENTATVAGRASADTPSVTLSITMNRKPLYFAFNIVLPILVLVVLNGMVFWLPVESGERVGFSVTCFLSFVVLLNMIMDILPRSSSPMSYLCFYAVSMMIFSGACTAIVILQMRLFHKPESHKVPRCMQKLLRVLRCRCCRRNRQVSTDGESDTVVVKVKPMPNGKGKGVNGKFLHSQPPSTPSDSCDDDEEEMTWQDVTRFLDKVLFLTFLGGQCLFTLMFIAPVAANV